jgi:glycosyltransferase involved in cell wall biosynthesis
MAKISMTSEFMADSSATSNINTGINSGINTEQTKNVLMLAYLFPPCAEGGVMRVRAFVKHLPEFGWQPIVLTVKDDYYVAFTKDNALVQEFGEHVKIIRTGSLEPKGTVVKQLQANIYGVKQTGSSFEKFGKPLLRQLHRTLAIPDEHILWMPHALRVGLHLIKQFDVDILFATTPPHSSGVIAAILSRLSGKPLVLDVRDDWVGNPLFAAGPWHRQKTARLLEQWIIATAHKVISVTEESIATFRSKYPKQPPDKFQLIPNGFDKQEIAVLTNQIVATKTNKLRLVYIGTLGRTRTPVYLFQALRQLMDDFPLTERLKLDIYGYTRHEFTAVSEQMGLGALVKFHGFVSREESLRQLILADAALMIIPEEEGSRTAIPGKLYEYIGVHRFVLALCPLNSAPSRLINDLKVGVVASQQDVSQIKQAIMGMLDLYARDELQVTVSDSILKQFERAEQARRLAETFNSLL